MNYKSVLIVTYGRSGSTLLQGLLNSIEGCVVRGENLNLCHGLFKTYQSISATLRDYGGKEGVSSPTSPWYGSHLLDETRFIEDARALVTHQLLGKDAGLENITCYGFKEIRYLPSGFLGGKQELKEYINFLCRLFPEVAIVVLTRAHEQVAQSAWWKNKEAAVVSATLSAFEDAMKEFSVQRKDIFFITYEDMVKRSDRIAGLFRFLGAPYDDVQVERVLGTPHSYAVDAATIVRQQKVQYQSSLANDSNIPYCLIDPLRMGSDGKHVRIGGVVVAPNVTDLKQELLLVGQGRELAIEWGLPSPKVGARFPGLPGAPHSRFRIDVPGWNNGGMQVVLKDSAGTRITVATVEALAGDSK